MAGKEDSPRPMTGGELRQFRRVAGMLGGSALVFMGIFGLLVHSDMVKIYPKSVSVDSLQTLGSRLEFTFRYQSLLVGWLMFSVMWVIFGRLTSRAINPLCPETELQVQEHKQILTNSFESVIISVLAQLGFVAVASPHCVLRYIPFVNVLMLVGRIAFHLGYPNRRTFGMTCTLTPNILLVLYNLWKLAAFVLGL